VPEPDLLSPLEERQIGGLGIYLMTRMMDEVTFDFDPDTGNLLTMVKYMAHTPVPSTLMVLPFSGRLDAQAAPRMREQAQALMAQGACTLIADLSNVYFLSSSGLRALLLIRKELLNRGGDLCIAAATQHVTEVLDLTGFVQVFTIYDTVEEARAAMAPSGA
jgi:serine/threonine-protein kinase RsbW